MREEESTLTISKNGDKFWRNKEGKRHRIDGPAAEYSDGSQEWYKNGKRHRIDGPAIEWKDGSQEWYKNGKRHRIDGPAIEHRDGDKSWFYNNIKFPTKEAFFEALTDEEKKIAIFSEAFLNA